MTFPKTPFLVLLLSYLPFELYAQNDNHINYTVADGLPSNMVYCVQQDDRGFMWFGTDAGLSRYDGYEFINYTLEDDLPDSEILHFFKDSQSRIWFYTLNGKVGFLKNDTIYSSKNTDWLLPLDFEGRITTIIEKDSKIYFSSVGTQIKVLDGIQSIIIEMGKTNRINSLCFCNNEVLVLSMYGIHIIKENFTVKMKLRYAPQELLYPFCFDNKIYAFDRSFGLHGIVQINDSLRDFRLPNDNVILNFEEHNGTLYLFRRNEVSVLDDKEMNVTLYSSSFKSISSMLFDLEGNTWLTSIEQGVYFQPKTEIKLKLNVKYATALETRNNQLLVAHDKRFVSSLDKEGKHVIRTSFEDYNHVNLIYNDPSDNIWIVRNEGLYLNNKKLTSLGGLSITTFNETYFLTGRSQALLGNSIICSQEKKYQLSSYGLSSALIGEDSILIGTDNGLMILNKDTIFEHAQSPLLKSRIANLVFDKKHNLWVGTGGNGLLKYNNGTPIQISKKDGLISDIINKMLITDDSVIWLSTPQGINKVVINKNGVNIKWLDDSNGLSSYKINDLKLYGKDIYLATNDGLFSFPKDIDLSEPNNFPLFIDKILVDNVGTKQSIFNHGIQSLQLNFKALTFRNHSSLRYQYQLTGQSTSPIDEKWLNTEFNQVNFSKLNPGRYHFYVRAKTKNSDWSPPISYAFEIKPAFWQAIWFQSIIIFCSVALVLFYFHQKNIRKQAQESLEKAKISAELKALKAQINPHFLFNVLNSIQSFILENEKDIAQEYLVKYGKLMRMVLDHSDRLIVPLQAELNMLTLYTDLEKLRIKHGFEFEIEMSEYFRENNVNVPSMVIQPFIENAIWHGLSSLNKKGKVILKIDHDEQHIIIDISDNGVGFNRTDNAEHSKDHTSSGVRLVQERLDLIQNPKSHKNSIEIKSQIGKGTHVSMTFSDSLI